jgi:GTP-binding protein EngB required for normal cell division
MSNTKSSVIDKLISLVPVWGYHHGQSEGFKRGMIEASQEYEKIYSQFQDELKQINRDVFGKEHSFIAPEGWDDVYWCQALEYFLDGNNIDLTVREIFFAFTKAFMQKMDEKNLKTIKGAPMTYRHLSMIQCTVSTAIDDLIKMDKSFLEITLDFIDLFLPLQYDEKHEKLAKDIITMRNEISTALSGASSCNILVMGRTGVGKSSLLNYLLGKDLFKSGVGKPQTMGFDEANGVINNVKVTVYDSRGLETGNDAFDYDEFCAELNKFKQKHDVFKSPYDWIHTAIYCVPKRVQEVDFEIINQCLKDKFNLVVAITKTDGLPDSDIKEIKTALLDACNLLQEENIIPICSVKKVDRAGNEITQFGRDALIDSVCSGFKTTILEYLPKRCVILAKDAVDKFHANLKKDIKAHDMAWIFNNEDVAWFKNKIENFQKKFAKELLPEIINNEMGEVVDSFSKMIYSYYSWDPSAGSSRIYYDKVVSPLLIKTFGIGLGGTIAKSMAVNVGVNIGSKFAFKSAFAAGGACLLPIPVINILLAIITAISISWDLWSKNDKLRAEFNKSLDEYVKTLKKALDAQIEGCIRDILRDAMTNQEASK